MPPSYLFETDLRGICLKPSTPFWCGKRQRVQQTTEWSSHTLEVLQTAKGLCVNMALSICVTLLEFRLNGFDIFDQTQFLYSSIYLWFYKIIAWIKRQIFVINKTALIKHNQNVIYTKFLDAQMTKTTYATERIWLLAFYPLYLERITILCHLSPFSPAEESKKSSVSKASANKNLRGWRTWTAIKNENSFLSFSKRPRQTCTFVAEFRMFLQLLQFFLLCR